MTLHIRNVQNIIKFSLKNFERDVQILRIAAGIEHLNLDIICTDTPYVKQMVKDSNKDNKVSLNDIPEFIASPEDQRLKELYGTSNKTESLGDIVIDLPTIFNKCRNENLDLHASLSSITTKGLCQLLACKNSQAPPIKEMDILNKYTKLLKISEEKCESKDSDESLKVTV